MHEREIILQFNLYKIPSSGWAIGGFQEHVMRLFDDACLGSTKGEKKYFIIPVISKKDIGMFIISSFKKTKKKWR